MKHFYDKYPSSFLYIRNTSYYYPEEFFTNLYNNHSYVFSDEFKEFLEISRNIDIHHNDFKIYENHDIVFCGFALRPFTEYEYTNPIKITTYGLIEEVEEMGFRFDELDKFFEIGDTVERQPVFMGIVEPYIGQVYMLNCTNGGWFADEPIRIDPDGLQVLPMHFLAPTFEAFIDLLYKNSNAYLENNNT